MRALRMLLLVLAPMLAQLASAQEDASDPAEALAQDDIDAWVHGAAERLVETQLRDGSWGAHQPSFPTGMTSLAAYALIAAGYAPEHPAVSRALAYLDARRPAKTYAIGCHMMLLASLHDPERKPEIEGLLVDLVATQSESGIWSYGGKRYQRASGGDFSNTQYAQLGLLAARRAGIEIPPEVLKRLMLATIEAMVADSGISAGLPYRPTEEAPEIRGTMVTAGLGILGFCRSELADELTDEGRAEIDLAIRRLSMWLGDHFSAERPPRSGNGWHYYYLYGLERAGALLPTETFGKHDWYDEGARFLLSRDPARFNDLNAAFAILFLRRATAVVSAPTDREEHRAISSPEGEMVRLGIAGEAPATFWIQGFHADLRETFEADPRGLRIKRVDYIVDGLRVGSILGDPRLTWTTERYPMRHHFERAGAHWIAARLHVAGKLAAVLDTKPLRFEVRTGTAAYLWEYPTHGLANEMRHVSVHASASSDHRNRNSMKQAVDGSQSSAWLCAEDDGRPTLTLTFDPPVRARRFLFSQANASADMLGRYAHARELGVRLQAADGRGTESEYTVRASKDELEKAELDLGRLQIIRAMEIELRDREPGRRDTQVAGLAEVEVLVE